MTVTVGGTNITFNDATTQTTAPVNTSANVNSITAGTGISVNSSTGAVTITNTNNASGTVTSVATGNGLSGGTITTSGTISLDVYTGTTQNNTSYPIGTTLFLLNTGGGANSTIANLRVNNIFGYFANTTGGGHTAISGTWRCRGTQLDGCNNYLYGICQRVS